MNKTTVMAILLASLFVASVSYANCGNGNGNGNGCSDVPGPQGPQGPKGDTGTTGATGTTGIQGVAGVNGSNADANAAIQADHQAKLVADTALRLYDGKRVQLQMFNVYSFGYHEGDDVFGQGRNLMFGVRAVVKLGKSYEERLLEKQDAHIKALEALVQKLSK